MARGTRCRRCGGWPAGRQRVARARQSGTVGLGWRVAAAVRHAPPSHAASTPRARAPGCPCSGTARGCARRQPPSSRGSTPPPPSQRNGCLQPRRPSRTAAAAAPPRCAAAWPAPAARARRRAVRTLGEVAPRSQQPQRAAAPGEVRRRAAAQARAATLLERPRRAVPAGKRGAPAAASYDQGPRYHVGSAFLGGPWTRA